MTPFLSACPFDVLWTDRRFDAVLRKNLVSGMTILAHRGRRESELDCLVVKTSSVRTDSFRVNLMLCHHRGVLVARDAQLHFLPRRYGHSCSRDRMRVPGTVTCCARRIILAGRGEPLAVDAVFKLRHDCAMGIFRTRGIDCMTFVVAGDLHACFLKPVRILLDIGMTLLAVNPCVDRGLEHIGADRVRVNR